MRLVRQSLIVYPGDPVEPGRYRHRSYGTELDAVAVDQDYVTQMANTVNEEAMQIAQATAGLQGDADADGELVSNLTQAMAQLNEDSNSLAGLAQQTGTRELEQYTAQVTQQVAAIAESLATYQEQYERDLVSQLTQATATLTEYTAYLVSLAGQVPDGGGPEPTEVPQGTLISVEELLD